jgi:hypothetical protein
MLSGTYNYFLSNAQIGTFFAYIKVSAAKQVGSKKRAEERKKALDLLGWMM